MPALSKPTRNWASSIIIWLKIIPRSLWIWLQAEPVGIICLIIGNECYKGIVLFLKCNNLRMFRPYNVRLEFELLGTCSVYSHPANQVSLSQTWQSFFGMRHWPLSSSLAGRPYYRQKAARAITFFVKFFKKIFFRKCTVILAYFSTRWIRIWHPFLSFFDLRLLYQDISTFTKFKITKFSVPFCNKGSNIALKVRKM